MTEPAISLRAVVRSYPTGVSVATVDVEGERLGLTLGSLVLLSVEPPLVGISVSRNAALHELLRRAGAFAVSLLGEGQEALAQHFARGVPPFGLWLGVEILGEPGEAPLLAGALGWIRCRLRAEHPVGDHTLFVGDVVTAERGRPAAPLVYVEGRYRTL
jgi:flavin reductase (DIM6/NTAB) family NADH-FMN oxidoreductase RutF